MSKLVAIVLGQDCERTIDLCLKSLYGCDKIYYLDGGSSDNTLEIVKKHTNNIWENEWIEDKLSMAAEQKNLMLKKLKETHMGDWCIYIDSDEMINDIPKLKEWIEKYGDILSKKSPIINIKMRHLIQNLVHEDATVHEHFALGRLFKICEELNFPQQEHCIIHYNEEPPLGSNMCRDVVIWHFAYCGGIWDVKRRYDGQIKRVGNESGHSEQFLNNWKLSHLFGQYPTKQVNPIELPQLLLDCFSIPKDMFYFQNRGLETKHFIDACHWKKFFECEDAYEFGCGRGPRVFAMNQIGIETFGLEISKYAFENSYNTNVQTGDILTCGEVGQTDLVIAYDLLEHINYKDLDIAIDRIIETSKKHILISVPVIGDPNLENDLTHIVKEDRNWWIKQFTDKGLKLIPTPEHFMFKEQILIFEKQ